MGYALVPRSVRACTARTVYVPLADAGLSSPVIMNCRAGDASGFLAEFRPMVMAVSRELIA